VLSCSCACSRARNAHAQTFCAASCSPFLRRDENNNPSWFEFVKHTAKKVYKRTITDSDLDSLCEDGLLREELIVNLYKDIVQAQFDAGSVLLNGFGVTDALNAVRDVLHHSRVEGVPLYYMYYAHLLAIDEMKQDLLRGASIMFMQKYAMAFETWFTEKAGIEREQSIVGEVLDTFLFPNGGHTHGIEGIYYKDIPCGSLTTVHITCGGGKTTMVAALAVMLNSIHYVHGEFEKSVAACTKSGRKWILLCGPNVSLVEQVVKLLLSDGLYDQLKELGLEHTTRVKKEQVMTRPEYDSPDRADVIADLKKVFLPVTARGARGVIEKVGPANIAGCIMDEVSKDMKELQLEEYEHIITDLSSTAAVLTLDAKLCEEVVGMGHDLRKSGGVFKQVFALPKVWWCRVKNNLWLDPPQALVEVARKHMQDVPTFGSCDTKAGAIHLASIVHRGFQRMYHNVVLVGKPTPECPNPDTIAEIKEAVAANKRCVAILVGSCKTERSEFEDLVNSKFTLFNSLVLAAFSSYVMSTGISWRVGKRGVPPDIHPRQPLSRV